MRRLAFTACFALAILFAAAVGVASEFGEGVEYRHEGMCDASAAIALSERTFIAASDEESQLRVYYKDDSGLPIWSMDVRRFLEVDPRHPETDIEGAARIGDLIFWITSHGRNKQGALRESRHRIFATRIEEGGMAVRPEGRPYRRLLEDLAKHEGVEDLDLASASQRAPKAEGGVNIEGLASAPDGTLWIGFRNPVPAGRAVLVQLLNPVGVTEGEQARLGQVVRLSLAGRGIREITWSGRDYVIVAGSYDGKGRSRLYRWSGPGHEPQRLPVRIPDGFNAEAAVFFPGEDADTIHLLSDDGSRKVDGVACKDLKTEHLRSFRSIRLHLGDESD